MFLLTSEPRDIETAYQLLETFRDSLQCLDASLQGPAKLLLQPIRLRINSFFAQAASLIRQGGTNLDTSGVVSAGRAPVERALQESP